MTNAFRQFCSLLMLLALLTAATLPSGFMPNLARASGGDAGLAPIVLCTATGFQTVYVPKDQAPGQETPADDTHQTHQPCPYAPANASAGLPALPAANTQHIVYRAAKVIYAAARTLRAKLPQKYSRSQAPPRI